MVKVEKNGKAVANKTILRNSGKVEKKEKRTAAKKTVPLETGPIPPLKRTINTEKSEGNASETQKEEVEPGNLSQTINTSVPNIFIEEKRAEVKATNEPGNGGA